MKPAKLQDVKKLLVKQFGEDYQLPFRLPGLEQPNVTEEEDIADRRYIDG